MNNQQHKLYNLEITPPEMAWGNIVDELNDIDAFKTVAEKLNNAVAEPPGLVWQKIELELHNEEFYNKIGEKLNSLSVPPPSLVWEKIERSIAEAQPETKVVSMQPKRRVLKYAAAACIVGLLGFFSYQMMEQSNKTTKEIYGRIQNNQTQSPQIASGNTKKVETKAAPAVKNAPAENAVNHSDENTLAATNVTPDNATSSATVYATSKENNKEIDGRYIVLMTDDGNVVRMSKKLENIADCIAGENNSANCEDQIQKWQTEMATSTVSASPDNFLDILELANKEVGL